MTTLGTISRFAIAPVLALLCGLLPALASAATTASSITTAAERSAYSAAVSAPAALQAWQAWILAEHPEVNCPWNASLSGRNCLWTDHMEIEVGDRGAELRLRIETFAETLVPLPGNAEHWPLAPQTQAGPLTLVDQAGQPSVWVPAGQHEITARYQWARTPARLAVPTLPAALSLRLHGNLVAPRLEGNDLLLTEPSTALQVEARDGLEIEVYRKILDGVPMQLETHLDLRVSGSSRTLTLDGWAPDGTEIMAVNSPIPAGLDRSGRLQLLLQAGQYQVVLRSRLPQDRIQFSWRPAHPGWPETEYWSVALHADWRGLKLPEAGRVDPQRVESPEPWRSLPTFAVRAEQPLVLERLPAPVTHARQEDAGLERTLWLDFDGRQMTVLDRFSGTLLDQWRLDSQPSVHPGSASVAAQPVMITRSASGAAGIEIRSPTLQAEVISRLEDPTHWEAIGWQLAVSRLEARIHLPPGWRVLFVHGADRVSDSWMQQWTLWALFICCLIVLALYYTLGLRTAALGLLTLALVHHEAGSPVYIWLPLCGLLALVPRVSGVRWRWLLWSGALLACLALVAILLNFAAQQLRLAVYPQLERSLQPASLVEQADMVVESAAAPRTAYQALKSGRSDRESKLYAPDTLALNGPGDLDLEGSGDIIQTGPGQPDWQWKQLHLTWTGPVTMEQTVRIWYSPVWLTRLWRIAGLVLTFALSACVLLALWRVRQQPGLRNDPSASSTPTIGPDSGGPGSSRGRTSLLLVLAISVGTGGLQTLPAEAASPEQGVAAAPGAGVFPPAELLEQYRQRLLSPPRCAPSCVGVLSGTLRVESARLRLDLKLHAGQAQSFALPSLHTTPTHLSLRHCDGRMLTLRRNEVGFPEALLSAGESCVRLEASLQEEVERLRFPWPIHHLQVESTGREIEGWTAGRVPGGTLALVRPPELATVQSTLPEISIAPYVRLTRTLRLERRWILENHLRRLAPEEGAFEVVVPRFPGEQILDREIEVEADGVRLRFGREEREKSWVSALEARPEIILEAAKDPRYAERWSLRTGPLWHVDAQGLRPLGGERPVYNPDWQPEAGDRLQLAVHRPEAEDGPTRTLTGVQLEWRPGQRMSEASLTLDLEASRSGELRLPLPPESEVVALQRDDVALELRGTDTLQLPLVPGTQRFLIRWRQPGGLGLVEQTPAIQLPLPASNIRISQLPSPNRWLLFLDGPLMGPALLFWGVLLLILITAAALAVIQRRLGLALPVQALDWLLLGLGLSTSFAWGLAPLAAALFSLALRLRWLPELLRYPRHLRWLDRLLILLLVTALGSLVIAVPNGLLSTPDMLFASPVPAAEGLSWYQDRSMDGTLPQATVVSAPLFVYRILMLLWSLWLSFKLLRWIAWGWQVMSKGAQARVSQGGTTDSADSASDPP